MQLWCIFSTYLQLLLQHFYLPRLEVQNGQKWLQVQTWIARSLCIPDLAGCTVSLSVCRC